MKFPSNSTDAQAGQDFLLLLGLIHPILREMRDAKAFTSQGKVFLLLHGSVAFTVPKDELSRRLSVAMAITERQGYLLMWFFAAPHDSELEPLLKEGMKFDPEPPAARNAGVTAAESGEAPTQGDAPAATARANPAPGATSQAAADSASGTSASLPASNSSPAASDASSQPQDDSASAPQPTRPTLLRPGETMDSQQGKGPPVRKH